MAVGFPRRFEGYQRSQENEVTVTQQPSTSTTKLEEGILGVDGTSNQAVNR